MGLLNKVGSWINDTLGVTSANKQQAQANIGLQKDAQAYSTWQMNNAHQIEVEDLKKAGINPILASGSDGAGAGVSANSTGAGGGGTLDPVGAITAIVNTMNNSAKTKADIQNQTDKTQAEVNKLLKDAGYTEKQIEYYNKYGVFPGATTTTKGSIGNKILGAEYSETTPVGLKTSAKKTKQEPKKSKYDISDALFK